MAPPIAGIGRLADFSRAWVHWRARLASTREYPGPSRLGELDWSEWRGDDTVRVRTGWGRSEQEHRLEVHAQMAVGAVTLTGTGDMHAARADKPQHQQRDRVPIADLLQHASANVVLHVQHEDPAWFQHAAAFRPDHLVQRAVLLPPLQRP